MPNNSPKGPYSSCHNLNIHLPHPIFTDKVDYKIQRVIQLHILPIDDSRTGLSQLEVEHLVLVFEGGPIQWSHFGPLIGILVVGDDIADIPQVPDVHHPEKDDGDGPPILGEDDNEIFVSFQKSVLEVRSLIR